MTSPGDLFRMHACHATQCLLHGVHAWDLPCKLPETLRSPPNTVPCEHSIALISKQVGHWGFLGRECVADPILCERSDWIDMRAQLAIVCERFAQLGDAVGVWPVASVVRSGSDRSYLFRAGFIPCVYTFRRAMPSNAGDPPNSMRTQADANAARSGADRS